MTDKVLFEELAAQSGHKVGVITLNAERSLNSLDMEMIDALYSQLTQWQNDNLIACVFIQGSGEKAFCAGGDVRALHAAAVSGNPESAQQFFETEYSVDYLIHTYNKPVICWGNGIVMGGGMGLMMGADFRIATDTTMMAMPEITIGLFPDVGASWMLNKLPAHIGRFMGLTGCRLNASDAVYLGLANRFIDHAFRSNVLDALQSADWGDDHYKTVFNIVHNYAESSEGWQPYSKVREHRDLICSLMDQPDLEAVFTALQALETDDKWLVKARDTALSGSLLSAAISFEQLERSRHRSLEEVFASELILAVNCTMKGDLAEGVRALLIDKDQKPEWKFSSLSDISREALEAYFTSA